MKTVKLSLIGAFAISLSACGATTGGLAQSMAKQAAMETVTSKVSTATTTETSTVAQPVDTMASCESLKLQLDETNAIITASNETLSSSGGNVASQLATTGATEAAVRTGVISKVPFGGFLAKAAKDTVENSNKKKIEQAQANLNAANLRKAELSGLYAGKNCAS